MSEDTEEKNDGAVDDVSQDNFFGDPSLGKGGRPRNLENGMSRKGQATVDMFLEKHYADGGLHPFEAMLKLAVMTGEDAKQMAAEFGVTKNEVFAAKMMGMNQVLKRTTPELKKMEIDAQGGAVVQFTAYMPPEDVEDLSEGVKNKKQPLRLMDGSDD